MDLSLLLDIELLAGIYFIIIASLAELSYRVKFFFFFIQNLIEALVPSLISQLISFLAISSSLMYGEIVYYIGFTHIFVQLAMYYKKRLNVVKISDDPYTLNFHKFGIKYRIQFGFYNLTMENHPTLEGFEIHRLGKQGTLSRSEYSKDIQISLKEILDTIIEAGNLSVNVLKLPGSSDRYPKFCILVYHIQSGNQNKDSGYSYFQSIVQLHLSDMNFSRVKGSEISYDTKNKLIKSLDGENICFDPVSILKYYNPPSFELGYYDLDIITELITHFNNQIQQFQSINGTYYLGTDINDQPISIDKPVNSLYFGSERHIPQLLKFDFLRNTVVFTDDKKLVSSIENVFSENVQIVDIDELSFDLIEKYRVDPQFFQIVLQLWEELIPASVKRSYKGASIASVISEFLNLHCLLDSEFSLKLGGLMDPKTYLEFSEDISPEVFNKFEGIFNNPFFNSEKIPIDTFFKNTGIKVIYIDNTDERLVIGLLTLFLVMKHHLLFPNPLLISFEEEGVGFEKTIASLLNYLDFNDVLLNLRTTGHITNWVQNFSLYLCDSSFGNENLKNHFFPNYPKINNGIYANLEFRQRFVLKGIV